MNLTDRTEIDQHPTRQGALGPNKPPNQDLLETYWLHDSRNNINVNLVGFPGFFGGCWHTCGGSCWVQGWVDLKQSDDEPGCWWVAPSCMIYWG